MVLLTINVRPKAGYSSPGKIKTIQVDSSERIEGVLQKLRVDTSKGINLFYGTHEVILNSSLASNNLQENGIVETCACPLLASALSAVLQDFNIVQQMLSEDERVREKVEPLLGLDGTQTLQPWPDRWTNEDLKSRTICLAYMKKVLQRNDRFAHLQVPHCTTLLEAHDFLQQSVFSMPDERSRSGRLHNSMQHIFKPVNKDGYPTTCWQLLQIKLDKMANIGATARVSGSNLRCPIETFLRMEHDRLNRLKRIRSPESKQSEGNRKKPPPSSVDPSPARKRRRLTLQSPSATRLSDKQWMCEFCKSEDSDSMCLVSGCPFEKKTSCLICFVANHPPLQRNHDRIQLTDSRAKKVLKELLRQERQNCYCPEFASGPFSILSTLYSQMKEHNQFSLAESRLKELAQQKCRSNLYDHQAQGRNAFACIEGLVERNLVRVERLPGMSEREGKYSLLPNGESLAKYCYLFETAVKDVISGNLNVVRSMRAEMNGNSLCERTSKNNSISIIVDTREDREFASRLNRRCLLAKISCEKRELPAGDYLFVLGDKVCSIVIERKSWSDLADSVMGRGRRRLECVRLDSREEQQRQQPQQCVKGKCQLCKMKASGCSKIMFVIEGARCSNLDDTPNKCKPTKRCQFCNDLQQRHGSNVVHETLEQVLYTLQVVHGCYIHFTRSYNETIDSLFTMRDILGENLTNSQQNVTLDKDHDIARAIALSLGEQTNLRDSSLSAPWLTYDQFCSNIRRKRKHEVNSKIEPSQARGKVLELTDASFIKPIFEGTMRTFVDKKLAKASSSSPIVNLNSSFRAAATMDEEKSYSDNSVEVVDQNSKGAPKGGSYTDYSVIEIDIDDEIEIVREVTPDGSLKVTSAAAQQSRRADCPRLSSRTLLMINGLIEYDAECFNDLSRVWKALYQQRAQKSSDQVFRNYCKEELQKLQNMESEVPLVNRDVTNFWLLALQLIDDVFVHVLRDTKGKQQLKSLWQKSSSALLSVNATTSQQADSEMIERGTPPKKQNNSTIPHRNRKRNNNCISARDMISTSSHRHLNPGVSNTDMCAIREARLLRFGQGGKLARKLTATRLSEKETSQDGLENSGNDRWSCVGCTYQNNGSRSACEMCNQPKPIPPWSCRHCTLDNESSESRCAACNAPRVELQKNEINSGAEVIVEIPDWERSSSSALDRAPLLAITGARPGSWSCSRCSLFNEAGDLQCDACGLECPDNTTLGGVRPEDNTTLGGVRPEELTSFDTKSGKKCGACGLVGHNRGNATRYNCPRYHDEAEVKLRAKKKEQNEAKAKKAKEKIQQIEREDTDTHSRIVEMERRMAELRAAHAEEGEMRQNEVKRLKKKQARAEKQARKYG